MNDTRAAHAPSIRSAQSRCAAGDLSAALDELRELIDGSPDDADALTFAGELSSTLGQPSVAAAYFRRVLALRPESAVILRKLANELMIAGELIEAVTVQRHALRLEPGVARAHNNLGRALERLERSEEALACYRRAIELDEGYALAHHNLANLLSHRGEHAAAMAHFDRALIMQPRLAESWHASAQLAMTQSSTEDCLRRVDRALALKPAMPGARALRALALLDLERPTDALREIRQALADHPSHTEAHATLGDLLHLQGDTRSAVDSYRRVVALDPSHDMARMAAAVAEIPALRMTPSETAESRLRFGTALRELRQSLQARPCADGARMIGFMQPFFLAYQEQDNRALLSEYGDICCQVMSDWQRQRGVPALVQSVNTNSKIRIGIVSAHLYDHSVFNALTRGWMQGLNRSRFEVSIIDLSRCSDHATAFARATASHYVTGQRPLIDWVQTIRSWSPDILLYPEIGMDVRTLQLASQRLAPVQAVAWGHPETTGLRTIDYFLSAAAFESDLADANYTERLVRLPNLGCYYDSTSIAGTNEIRQNSVTAQPQLICAGTPFKYAPEHDPVLVRIAQSLGRCQFHFFKHKDGWLSIRLLDRLSAAFSSAGLDPREYLVLNPWESAEKFRQRLSAADLLLDTIGFSGFNTVLQALECHLPVVAYRGRFLRGRLGAGLIDRVGLGAELVVDDPDRFVERVVHLARPSAERSEIRRRIAQNLPRLYRDEASIAALETFCIDSANRARV